MFKKILFAGVLVASSSAVMAIPMTGGFEFDTGTTTNTVTSNLDGTGTVTFSPSGSFITKNSYGTINDGEAGVLGNFDYDENVNTVSPLVPGALFTIGTFEFSLTNVSDVTEIVVGSSANLFVQGFGVLSDTALGSIWDDTTFVWSFSTSNAGSPTGSWSASAVPAPAGLALLGLGLVGISLMRRNKNAA